MSAFRPRLLLATPDFLPLPGGIQLLMHELVRHMRRVDVGVLTFAAPGAATIDARLNRRVTRIAYDRRAHRACVAALNVATVATVARRRPDVVLSGHAVLAPATSLLRLAGRFPVVQYAYADEFDEQPGLARRAVRVAHATVAISRFTAALCAEAGADPARVHIISPGVSLPHHRPRMDERAMRPTVVTVSRMTEVYKGHDVMLEALVRVREAVPDVEWAVVGDGPLREALQRRGAELGLDGSVSWLGELTDAQRDAHLERAHVFCLPSRLRPSGQGGEGFGIVYLEAGTRGLPVVAGAIGGTLDAVVDGETGLLVDPESPDAVANALITLLRDPQRARTLAEGGWRRAQEHGWARVATRVEEIVFELARGAR